MKKSNTFIEIYPGMARREIPKNTDTAYQEYSNFRDGHSDTDGRMNRHDHAAQAHRFGLAFGTDDPRRLRPGRNI